MLVKFKKAYLLGGYVLKSVIFLSVPKKISFPYQHFLCPLLDQLDLDRPAAHQKIIHCPPNFLYVTKRSRQFALLAVHSNNVSLSTAPQVKLSPGARAPVRKQA